MSESVKPWMWSRLKSTLVEDGPAAEKRGYLQIWRGTAPPARAPFAAEHGIRAGAHGLFATGFDTRVSDTKHIMRAHITDSCWTKVVKDHARLSPQSLVGAVISPKRFWFDLEKDIDNPSTAHPPRLIMVIEEMEYLDCAGGGSFGEPCDIYDDPEAASFLQNFVLSIANDARYFLSESTQDTGNGAAGLLPTHAPHRLPQTASQLQNIDGAHNVLQHFLLSRQNKISATPFNCPKSICESKKPKAIHSARGYFRDKHDLEDWEFDVSDEEKQKQSDYVGQAQQGTLENVKNKQDLSAALAALSQEPADLAEGCSYALAPSGLELEDLSSEESAGAESMEKQTAVELGKYAVPSEDDSDDALCTQLPEGHLLEAAFTKDDSVPLLGEAPVCGNRKRARTEDDHGSVPVSPALKSPKIAKATQSPVLTRNLRQHTRSEKLLESLCLQHVNKLLFYELRG